MTGCEADRKYHKHRDRWDYKILTKVLWKPYTRHTRQRDKKKDRMNVYWVKVGIRIKPDRGTRRIGGLNCY